MNVPVKLCVSGCLLLLISSCSVIRQSEDMLAHKDQYISPYFFISHPARIQLMDGNTVTGHFTKGDDAFYQLHDNADSNLLLTKTRYPVTSYYKRYECAEVSNYAVSDLQFEAVIVEKEQIDRVVPWKNENIIYMQRLSPDSSFIQLYRYYLDYDQDTSLHHDPISYTIRMSLSPPDTIFPNRSFYYIYYVHLPGQPAQQVFNLYNMSQPQRETLLHLFGEYEAMKPEVDKILADPKVANMAFTMVGRKNYTHIRIEPSLLEIFARFDRCMKKN